MAVGKLSMVASLSDFNFATNPMGDLSDTVADDATSLVSQHAEHAEPVAGVVGGTVGGVVGGAAGGLGHVPRAVVGDKLASKVASRFVSSGVNAILLYRLGWATVRQLRPLQERPGAS